ncbi:Retrovirus-related Pol polyprotein from transposon TNT 1-94 [Sesamum alatum]|uniref:Retrovirus-related Pol polyprotein from transposon TNT 1-94 n=1 Tax=Sesamum alatum TaxID=300844 RepID=A0AAE1YYH1_9LAMI|nr:Retrovirus-related Pol polyprotein from transposon TNT 1-94 [Sesamum alatum]
MGNEDTYQIVGRGDIILSSNVGCQIILKDVRHVPDMRLNLVSVGKLDNDGSSHFAKLPNQFRGAAVKSVVDLINILPSVPFDKEIPEEVWSRKKASYSHLKVFGCQAFAHIPKDERAKLDSKTKQCIYLGAPKYEFGYRLWDPIKKKIVRSRDVVFFENWTIEDIKKPEIWANAWHRLDIFQINT